MKTEQETTRIHKLRRSQMGCSIPYPLDCVNYLLPQDFEKVKNFNDIPKRK